MDPSKCAKYILWTLSTFCKHYLHYVINNEYATDNIYTTSSDSTMIAKKNTSMWSVYVLYLEEQYVSVLIHLWHLLIIYCVLQN